jgi:hypothetical protein
VTNSFFLRPIKETPPRQGHKIRGLQNLYALSTFKYNQQPTTRRTIGRRK